MHLVTSVLLYRRIAGRGAIQPCRERSPVPRGPGAAGAQVAARALRVPGPRDHALGARGQAVEGQSPHPGQW